MNLSYNFIGAEGAAILADALCTTASVTELSLNFNDLRDAGVVAICEAVQSNKETQLASLSITENGVGPVGAKAVAAMLAAIGSMTRVDARWNDLREEGKAALSAVERQGLQLVL